MSPDPDPRQLTIGGLLLRKELEEVQAHFTRFRSRHPELASLDPSFAANVDAFEEMLRRLRNQLPP